MPIPILAIVSAVFPYVVKLAEKLIGNGNGEVKKTLAVQLAEAVLAVLQTQDPSVGLPDKTELPKLIQDTWANLNAKKELTGTTTAVDPTPALQPAQSPQLAACVQASHLMLQGAMKLLEACALPATS